MRADERGAAPIGAGYRRRSRGIGFEVCWQLARGGMSVVLGARDPEKAELAAKELSAEGLDVLYHAVDVFEDASVGRLATWLEEEIGKLDVLVNNAAAYVDWSETALTADSNAAHKVLDVNLCGTWQVCQTLLPLLHRSAHGRIVNVSTGAGSHGDLQFGLTTNRGSVSSYGISKAAVNALNAKLAAELEGTGILVNSVCRA
jgi:NAD(P)-dependent dehydrogenase (short-subunit alcohol dehydrogenase family)